jgi:hypothetical protein
VKILVPAELKNRRPLEILISTGSCLRPQKCETLIIASFRDIPPPSIFLGIQLVMQIAKIGIGTAKNHRKKIRAIESPQ